MIPKDCKRLAEVDYPIAEVSRHSARGPLVSSRASLLSVDQRRMAKDRPDCFWLYVVTDCDNAPRLQEPIRDPARLDWNEVTKVTHYYLNYLAVNAMTKPMQVREDSPPHGGTS